MEASTPSPRHSTSPPTTNSSPLAPWHFPGGPSYKFSRHHRSHSQHTTPQPTYTSVAPSLSTARRAHRRAQSSANVPTITNALSPPSSDYARSPLSRFSSYQSPKMAHKADTIGPLTPAKGLFSSRPTSKMQDSPHSDYFSNDGRDSVHEPYSTPSWETQQLLVRINKLQSQLMRSEPSSQLATLNIVQGKISEIEANLNALHSQTRMPPEMEDSGLFLEEEDEQEDRDETPNGSYVNQLQGLDGASDPFAGPVTPEHKQAEHEFLLLQAQNVLDNVTTAQEKLQKQHAELRELNDAHMVRLEQTEREIEELRSENETLKSDLGFDHSELLFLKLQLKALEVETEAMNDGAVKLEEYAPQLRGDIQKVKRDCISEEMDKWHSDWSDVDLRMRKRRNTHRVLSADLKADSPLSEGQTDAWQLQTVKRKGHGRVESITIRRLSGESTPPFDLDGATEVDVEDEQVLTTTIQVLAETQPHPHKTIPPSSKYIDQGTQTTHSVPLTTFIDQPEPELEVEEEGFADDDHANDCAITTSSEDNSHMSTFSSDSDTEDDYHDQEEPKSPSAFKAALSDLWVGLANLSGMGEE